MAVYKIFPTKDATIYSLFPNMNTGLDEIIEATETQISSTNNSNPAASRFLIQFSPDEIDNVLEKRGSKLIKTVELFDDEAELFIYDNGAIDGDIITLIDNGTVLLKKALLSKNPIKLKINNLDDRVHNIHFFAENLGEIPPNTGLLVIKTKSTKIEMFFSSDLAQSSLIKILLK